MQPPQLPWMYGILPQVHRLPYLVQVILQNILQKQSQVQEAIWALHWYLLEDQLGLLCLEAVLATLCKTTFTWMCRGQGSMIRSMPRRG